MVRLVFGRILLHSGWVPGWTSVGCIGMRPLLFPDAFVCHTKRRHSTMNIAIQEIHSYNTVQQKHEETFHTSDYLKNRIQKFKLFHFWQAFQPKPTSFNTGILAKWCALFLGAFFCIPVRFWSDLGWVHWDAPYFISRCPSFCHSINLKEGVW